jgi:hypothetical protein
VLPGPRVSAAPRRARPAPRRCSPGPAVTRSRLSATRVRAARALPPTTICVYYASMLRCWHLVWILVMTDHPYLVVKCHSRNPEIVTIGFNADRRLRPHVGAVHRGEPPSQRGAAVQGSSTSCSPRRFSGGRFRPRRWSHSPCAPATTTSAAASVFKDFD